MIVGVYYVWFRDTSGNTVSDSVEVSTFDTTKPSCTWGLPSKSVLQANEEATITLTCTDNESGIDNSVKLNVNDINLSTNSIEVKSITEEQITNGYKYIVAIKQRRDNGSVTLTIPSNKIKDIAGNGNDEVTSSEIEMSKSYNISYKDVGDLEFSGVHEEGYPVSYSSGLITILDMPTKKGYSFSGYYLDSDGSGEVITSISDTQTEDITLYAKWIDNIAPYGVANLSLNEGIFTLSLSNYGDEGSGIVNAYGYAISTSSTCSGASYIESSELSMEFNDTYEIDTKYYGCIRLTDNAGNVGYIVSGGLDFQLGEKFNEVYSQTFYGEYTYTVPSTGKYKLEVWGAQGGSDCCGGIGGYGGFSSGTITLKKNSILYILVGRSGGSGGNNGAGAAYSSGAAGGGATHIATSSGLLSTFSSKTDEILIVAGGGGGAGDYGSGGAGGGYKGNNGTATNGYTSTGNYSKGGTQTSGYAFGKAGNAWGGQAPGGGSGYYGGYAGGTGDGSGMYGASIGGGGGSGYIGNNLLTDKHMYCYNCATSTEESTKTYTTTNVSEDPISNYAKKGGGAVKITANFITDAATINIIYYNNGGTGCYSKSVSIGESYGLLCTPTRSGYAFNGWWTSIDGGTQITSDTIVTSDTDHTIYAHWTEATKPVITFEINGNAEYTNDEISSMITVTKGSSTLNPTTFKYIFSKDNDAEPTDSFISGNIYSLSEGEGIYYLIAEACDINGECTKEVSEPFYLDTVKPSATISSLNASGITISVEVNASDNGSGILKYGYLVQTSDVCPTTGYVESENPNYSFNMTEDGTYYICVKVFDNANNYLIIKSDAISMTVIIDYQTLSNNYSCANSSVGDNPLVVYTGNCEVIDDGDGNYRVKFLSSGDLTLNVPLNVDLFLVGGGGGGSSGGGGGGYTKTYFDQSISLGVQTIVVGSGGAATKAGGVSYFGDKTVYFANGGNASSGGNGGNGGSGGGAHGCKYCSSFGTGCTDWCCATSKYNDSQGASYGKNASSPSASSCFYDGSGTGGKGQGTTTCEFDQGTTSSCNSGVTSYSRGGIGASSTPNSGNGGNVSGAGSSGIVIIRNKR